MEFIFNDKVIFIIGEFILIFVALAIHELGHLFMGLAQGFKFQLFVIGFFGVKRNESDEIVFYLNKDLNYFGGVASCIPIADDIENSKKFSSMIIAGPIASLIFSVLFFTGAFFLTGMVKFLMISGGLINFGILLATTIPGKSGMFYSDRKRYQRLINNGKEREIELALLRVLAQSSSKNYIDKLNVNDLQLIKQDKSTFLQYFGTFYEYLYFLNREPELLPNLEIELKKLSVKIPKNVIKLFDKELEKITASKE